ncbi:hypothetical protein KVT40_002646 [Elsinoe batatas]|uniref:Uncharacterized protein n=1 Tax=Elsinoe batatas TaxID=2601811 RepID=A0A8K0L2M6_9PEZI|nr:hypothetical protein KVT40_002646 [Elsinoe batatas]
MSIPFLPLLGPTFSLLISFAAFFSNRCIGYTLFINNIKCISVRDQKDIPTRARAKLRASRSFGFVPSCRASDTPGCLPLDGRSGALTAFVWRRRG